MAHKLVIAGYDPKAVLEALNLPAIPHTGLPSTQLQHLSTMNVDDLEKVYEVE
jgi:hypothetical protein